MKTYLEMAEAIVKNNQEPGWLRDLRLDALKSFEQASQPSRSDEDWRRTDVSRMLYSDSVADTDAASFEQAVSAWDPSSHFSKTGKSALLQGEVPSGVLFMPLSEAVKKFPDKVRPCLERSQKHNADKFYAMANALWNGGVFLCVPKNTVLKTPLSAILRPIVRAEGRRSFFPKAIVVMEACSSAALFLDETDPGDWEGWTQSTMEVHLKADASLTLARIQRNGAGSTVLSSVNADLESSARLNALSVQLGTPLHKSGFNAVLSGEGAAAHLYGLVKGQNLEHYDQTVLVDHRVPNTSSDVLYKAVMRDKSRTVFNGLIHVRKAARKTDAHQSNRNLLLSREARADTIPKLEIETDDVKCGHGAAVSNLDPDQLYYLMSRGLSRIDAENMIVDGFYEDVVGQWLEETNLTSKGAVLSWVRAILFGSQASLSPETEPEWLTQK